MTSVNNEFHLERGLVAPSKMTQGQLARFYQRLSESLENMRQRDTPDSWYRLLDAYKAAADRRARELNVRLSVAGIG